MKHGLNLETIFPEMGAVPIDTTGAVVTGTAVNMANYGKLMIVISQGAWAGGTPAVTLTQATVEAFTDEKSLAMDYYWTKLAGASITTKTAITSDTFNLPATANTVTVLQIDASDLDSDNEFNWVRVNIASPGANADLISVFYILGEPDYVSSIPVDPNA